MPNLKRSLHKFVPSTQQGARWHMQSQVGIIIIPEKW
ncbi:hypothetical protein C7972_101523 [Arenibacter sp. ARW7G5Y1]|nr:hypothetical protein C7972_101523 [Arenibacter sp. ARW7G5Y1]